MDLLPETPWDATPDLSARIVTAMARLASVLRAGMWAASTAEQLNPAQADIVQLLHRRVRGMRLSWLAQQLSISTASASDSVAALVAKGYVRKTRAADDGRATALLLTPEGEQLAGRLESALGFADEAVSALPQPLQVALLTGLFKTIAELQKTERFPELRACLSCRHFEPNKFPGAAAPHHCALVGAPLPIAFLRIDCAEHEPADAAAAQRNWQTFA